MRPSVLAILLLCPDIGGPAADRGECAAPEPEAVAGEREPERDGETSALEPVEYRVRRAVVEHPERYRILLVREDETMTFPMLVLPDRGPKPIGP